MTVGIVVVSHSAQLARGVVELAGQMTQGKTPLAAAGGVEDDILGTSVEKILAAVLEVDNPDGVLVLLDLGSAILSTEMALEMLEPEQQARVRLSHAPLVEGAITGALEASLGHSLAQVKLAAEQAASDERLRQLKPISQDEEVADLAQSDASEAAQTVPTEPAYSVSLVLENAAGLHARPASLFVQAVARYRARVEVSLRGKKANAASIMDVLSLSARQHDEITLSASGPEAQEALDALKQLVIAQFYETVPLVESDGRPATQLEGEVWRGEAAAPGIALGRAYRYKAIEYATQPRTLSVSEEQQRLREAELRAERELADLAAYVREKIGPGEAGIFEAQALMLGDPDLFDAALKRIAEQGEDAASALREAGEQQEMMLSQLGNEMLAARAADVRDVVERTTRLLAGREASRLDVMLAKEKAVVLVAYELLPSEVARLDPRRVLGICTIVGGKVTHAAILARALGIPAVAGLDKTMLASVRTGDELAIDGDNGLIYPDPSEKLKRQLKRK